MLTVPTGAAHQRRRRPTSRSWSTARRSRPTVESATAYGATTEIRPGLEAGDEVVHHHAAAAHRHRTGRRNERRRLRGIGGGAGGGCRRAAVLRRGSPAAGRRRAVSLIELVGVRKTYAPAHLEVDALRDVDARIDEGEYVAVDRARRARASRR